MTACTGAAHYLYVADDEPKETRSAEKVRRWTTALEQAETALVAAVVEALIIALNPHNPVCISGCDTCARFNALDQMHRAKVGALKELMANALASAEDDQQALRAEVARLTQRVQELEERGHCPDCQRSHP